MFTPAELSMGGIFLPPLFVSSIFAVIFAGMSASWLNRKRLSKYFFYPPLVFVSLLVIYTVLIGTFIFPG
jgi:hypothetical protein